MKRKFIKLVVIATVMSIMLSGCAGCAGCNKNDTPVNTTPTAAVTATTAPTATVEPTKDVEPTIAPAPTEVPATPTPLPTPEPTATPIPTNTPVPTMAVAEGAVLVDSVKMGDNVWYDFYDDGTLVVRGTGATRDVKNEFYSEPGKVSVWNKDKDYYNGIKAYKVNVLTIIIEDGITGLGDWSLSGFFRVKSVSFPSSLKTIGYAALFDTICETTECIGLRTDMEIGQYALTNGMNPVKNVPAEFKEYTVAPTPLPLPTATPLPNPDKPRNYATKKMGDNVTFEFWDNGYLYVKGTGATWDKDWTFFEFRDEPYSKTHTVIVEEGITYLGNFVLQGLESVVHFQLPKTLTSIGHESTCSWGLNTTITGYYNGKKATLKTKNASNPYGGPSTFFKVLGDIDAAIADGYEITFE